MQAHFASGQLTASAAQRLGDGPIWTAGPSHRRHTHDKQSTALFACFLSGVSGVRSMPETDLARWLSDPDRKRKRTVALRRISGAIDTVAMKWGYSKIDDRSWEKKTLLIETSLTLQPNRKTGTHATLNLKHKDRIHGWTAPGGTVVHLGNFYRMTERDSSGRDGAFVYQDIYTDEAALREPISVLDERALPWLEAHRTLWTLLRYRKPSIADYI